MRIYHTCASRNDVAKARRLAPSYEHGFGWIPEKMCAHDAPYFVDNGCFNPEGEEWPQEKFLGRLGDIGEKMPREPEFVVLPDVWGDGMLSLVRSAQWVDDVAAFEYDYYLPVQDGMPVEQAVRAAVEIGAAGVFVGGSDEFKREYAGQFSMTAHDYGLKCHIGKPGPSLSWARDLGVDSVDTASIVRNGYWNRLRKLEGTERTAEVKLTEVPADD